MYKVFAGEKCVIISEREQKVDDRISKLIPFSSAEELHKEYRQFARNSKVKTLVITGDVERTWTVFRSLFAYIEASGGFVKNDKGSLMMIYRNRHWDLPKGRMEKGETPDQTALREVEEECGVKDLKIVKKIMMTHHIFHQDKNE